MPTKLSRLTRLVIVCIATGALLASCMSADSQAAFDALNKDRAANGEAALQYNEMLRAKAQAWSDTLAARGALSHSVLTDGITGCWKSLGENVGYGPSIDGVEAAYMQSTGHRANILSTAYQYVGTGVSWSGSTVYTVQVFMQGC